MIDEHPDTSEPRPGTCCGACPPIAGGSWDCTCPGNPRCSVSAPAAEWDDLARLAEDTTPGPWVADHSEEDNSAVKQEGRAWWDGLAFCGRPADAEFIAAANPATILHLIKELQIAERASQANANAHMYAERKANALAARLAAVEALADQMAGEHGIAGPIAAARLRAALAAPTDAELL